MKAEPHNWSVPDRVRGLISGRVRCRGDAGGAMVEMAVMFPVVVAVVLGTVSTGVMLNERFALSQATREAARYGATLPSSQLFTNDGTWAANVSSVLVSRSNGEMNVAGATLCVSLVEGSGAGRVYVVSGPFAPSAYTTNSDGKPCDASETYPMTLYDLGRRVQVRLSRPARIELGVASWDVRLTTALSAKSESAG